MYKLIDAQRTLHTRYQNEIGWLQNDREYLSIIAGDRMDLMKPGETIFRVEPRQALRPTVRHSAALSRVAPRDSVALIDPSLAEVSNRRRGSYARGTVRYEFGS